MIMIRIKTSFLATIKAFFIVQLFMWLNLYLKTGSINQIDALLNFKYIKYSAIGFLLVWVISYCFTYLDTSYPDNKL